MSYTWAASLQAAIYARLKSDAALLDLVGDQIYDEPLGIKPDEAAAEHVTLGPETVRPWNTKTSRGAQHDFDITVHSQRTGFGAAKRIAAAICDALIDAPLGLENGRLVALRFVRAKAERGRPPERRRIALRFRAVLDEDT